MGLPGPLGAGLPTGLIPLRELQTEGLGYSGGKRSEKGGKWVPS